MRVYIYCPNSVAQLSLLYGIERPVPGKAAVGDWAAKRHCAFLSFQQTHTLSQLLCFYVIFQLVERGSWLAGCLSLLLQLETHFYWAGCEQELGNRCEWERPLPRRRRRRRLIDWPGAKTNFAPTPITYLIHAAQTWFDQWTNKWHSRVLAPSSHLKLVRGWIGVFKDGGASWFFLVGLVGEFGRANISAKNFIKSWCFRLFISNSAILIHNFTTIIVFTQNRQPIYSIVIKML
jgi:hypothetical protein